jgi:glycosyltransferase involved in cell wall biosynthesis
MQIARHTVDLLMRADYRTKPGGDVVIAESFARALNDAGAHATLRPLTQSTLRHATDVIHLFNLDRRVEFGSAAKAAMSDGRRRLAISPIHHPTARVAYFESSVRSGPLKVVNVLGRDVVGRERIKHVLRTHSPRGVWEATIDSRYNGRSIARALQKASLIVVQAEGERREVEASFGISLAHNVKVVPNTVDVDDTIQIDIPRDIDVLVVGRIEERKNQLHLAEALKDMPWRVVFLGGVNARSRGYQAAFDRLIAESTNLEHHHIRHSEMPSVYARAKVLVSASHFEVVSMAELEAVGYGCQLVGATSGYMMEYLGPSASFLDPIAPADAWVQAIAAARSGGINRAGMDLVRTQFNRHHAAKELVAAYVDADLLG